jgi:hypothetical protein
LPQRPYCTDDLETGTRIRRRDIAATKAYLQPNHAKHIVYLPFDIDRQNAGAAWIDGDVPQPTITVFNPNNGHAHLLYELSVPVTDHYEHLKPMRYLEAIRYAYTERLEADAGYAGILIKNPLHSRWPVRCNDVAYSLGELAEYVELVPYYQRKPANDLSVLGRNCSLFEQARQYAYQIAKKHGTEHNLMADIENFCLEHNVFAIALSLAEVRCIAKSVSRWTWKHRHELGTKKRLLQLDRALPLTERQSLGAAHTASVKHKATEKRIIQAIGDLPATGKRITKAEVSRVTGIHRKTLERFYGHLFHGVTMDT